MTRSGVARAITVACFVGSAALAGCTTVTRLGSHDAAPRLADVGVSVACGPTTCAPGTTCCNASCGICTPPGTSCIEIPCTDAGGLSCGADDATLEGDCGRFFLWTGSTCEARIGCTCSGRDCKRLQTTAGACFESHGECWSHACTLAESSCPTGFFCEALACEDATGVCALRPESCSGVLEPVVCGCDGAAYAGSCRARQSAVSRSPSESCGLCDASVATIAGSCSSTLGYVWDGGRCAVVRGCSCTGACDRLYASAADCEVARAPCLTFACEAVRCRRWDEVCVSAGSGTRCDPLPGGCEGVPSCTCIGPTASCTELGPGAFVTTPL